jgi:hypothetical protein
MSPRTARTPHTAGTAQPEQLSLMRSSELPVQFRLDRRTRERGLEHVAEIRRLLQTKLQSDPGVSLDASTGHPGIGTAARRDQAA